MAADGTCPTCGRRLDRPEPLGGPDERGSGPEDGAGGPQEEGEVPVTAPWHFWLLVIAVVAYLGWRLIQGLGWAAGQF